MLDLIVSVPDHRFPFYFPRRFPWYWRRAAIYGKGTKRNGCFFFFFFFFFFSLKD